MEQKWKQNLHPVLTIRLFAEEKCFGPGLAQLLRLVEKHGSLRAAASAMGMAYSKAWTIVRRGEENLGFSLLLSTVGGRHGGGAALTEQAKGILAAYESYRAALTTYGLALFREMFGSYLQAPEQKKDL